MFRASVFLASALTGLNCLRGTLAGFAICAGFATAARNGSTNAAG
jgi:hypothetical protein